MSFDHWWISVFVDAAEYEAFEPAFAAAQKAAASSEATRILNAWRDRSFDSELDVATNEQIAKRIDAFIQAFNLPGFAELARDICTQDGRFASFDLERHGFRMVIAARYTPVSVLWYALGYERAGLLPGQLGNLLLHPRETDSALRNTERAFAGTSSDGLLESGRRYCGHSVSDESLREILDFLPTALAQANERKQGLLALARAQI
jgi:hypothetical protein